VAEMLLGQGKASPWLSQEQQACCIPGVWSESLGFVPVSPDSSWLKHQDTPGEKEQGKHIQK